MRIDAHHHFWRYSATEYDWISPAMAVIQRDFLPADLRPELASVGIDGTVVVQARQHDDETRWLLNLAADYDFIKAVVGWIDLRADDLAQQLGRYRNTPVLKGFRHVLEGEPEPDFMLQDDFVRGVTTLAEHGYSYDLLVHAGQLPQTVELVRRLPVMRLVVDHLAKPDIKHQSWQRWHEGITELASFEHLYCKVSGMVTEADWHNWTAADFEPYLNHIFRAFGPHRVMFGSDWPVCRVAGEYGQTYQLVADYVRQHYPDHEAAIFGGNAVVFYRLANHHNKNQKA